MAVKKTEKQKEPAKQKKAKDLDVSKTKGGENVKGGARFKYDIKAQKEI
jgi:hypothetical protein